MYTRTILTLACGATALRQRRRAGQVGNRDGGPPVHPSEERGFPGAVLDLKRKDSIIHASPIDHSRDVVLARYPDFDLNKTIFNTIDSWVKQQYLSATLNVQAHWSDKAVFRIDADFFRFPPPPDVNRDMLHWMNTECDFAMEHADGSFLDHLKWGYEYTTVHYHQQSPNVLLLHSVMGVGTNFFPMRKDQIPKLQTFITAEEWTQAEVFPSMLRLLFSDTLLPELERAGDTVSELVSIDMHRVIDNKLVSLSAEEFWVAMNFQLVHLIDFLPTANWNESYTFNDNFLFLFTNLYNFMKRTGKLEATVSMVPPTRGGDVGPHPSLTFGSVMNQIAPDWIKWSMFTSSVVGFSEAIGHSLDYRLVWKSAATCPRATGERCLIFCDGAGATCSNLKCVCPAGLCASNQGCVKPEAGTSGPSALGPEARAKARAKAKGKARAKGKAGPL